MVAYFHVSMHFLRNLKTGLDLCSKTPHSRSSFFSARESNNEMMKELKLTHRLQLLTGRADQLQIFGFKQNPTIETTETTKTFGKILPYPM